ncbi:hypothetical protein SFRURICE_015785 [Spodoptera frugiperda]|nr:hypothetical protein SFRURICE_015785 [Spodoptera frugiperda]
MLQMVTQLKAPRYDTKKDPFDKSLHNSISTLLDLTKLDHQALVDFFIQHWATDEMVPFIGNSQVFINFKECHSYMVYNNKVLLNIDDSLSCLKHKEADTKIIYHICVLILILLQ